MKAMIIAGGTGFLGNALIQHFKDKVTHIYVLTRSQKATYKNVSYVTWDGKTKGNWATLVNGADVLINMTGKSVDCRYTQHNKELIMSSRIDATNILGEVIKACDAPPKIWLNASTATIYKNSLHKEMDEDTGEIGTNFSENVAKTWEHTFFNFKLPKTRQVALRTSIVMGEKGGAFIPLKNLTKLGLGGKQGEGAQKVSWIHEKDFVRSIEFIIKNHKIKGAINITAPKPTTNKKLMKQLRMTLGIPFGISINKSLLEFGAKIIRTETELVLKSRNVIPKKLLEYGFTFQYGNLGSCVMSLTR